MLFTSIEHIGVPHKDPMEGEIYLEGMKLYVVPPEATPFKYEYLRFMEGTPFPAIMHNQIHVAGMVDCIDEAIKEVDEVIMPKFEGSDAYLCFVIKDGVILELMEKK